MFSAGYQHGSRASCSPPGTNGSGNPARAWSPAWDMVVGGSLQWLPARVMSGLPRWHTQPASAAAAPPAKRKTPATFTTRHGPYLLVRLRVRPERHRAQSCTIALPSPAPDPACAIFTRYSPHAISIARRDPPRAAPPCTAAEARRKRRRRCCPAPPCTAAAEATRTRRTRTRLARLIGYCGLRIGLPRKSSSKGCPRKRSASLRHRQDRVVVSGGGKSVRRSCAGCVGSPHCLSPRCC